MIKVCILTSAHPALDVRIFHKEARALAQAGYDVALVAQHNKNETVDGVRIIALPDPGNRFRRMTKGTWEILMLAMKQSAHIYHFHDPELIPVGIILRLFRNKVIYDVHEDVPSQILDKEWIPKIVRSPIAMIFNIFEKSVSKKIDYVITATPYIKNNFRQENAIDVKNYPTTENLESCKKDYSLVPTKSHYSLIYVGGLEKNRGIKEIIDSLKFIDKKYAVKLRLIGGFSDREFERNMKDSINRDKIEFVGWIPHEKIFQNLSEADVGIVCLHPLKQFIPSLPIKMFEYMSAGLPIIASDFPLWEEIIKGNKCGSCVNPLEPKEIAKAIEYLIEHPEEAKKMGENGREAVLEKYNWKNESERLLRIYERLSE